MPRIFRTLVPSVLVLAACASQTDPEGAASSEDLSAKARAELPPLPQVLNFGGAVQDHPRIVPVVWATDPDHTRILHFYEELADSGYWGKTTREYGVGALDVASPIVLTTAPPVKTSDEEIQALLTSMLDGTHPEWPKPDTNTTFVFTHPAGSEVDLAGGNGDVCTSALGYHSNLTTATGPAVYVVVPRCPGGLGKPNTPIGFDVVTSVLSHEIIEAASDPLPMDQSTGAWWDYDPNSIGYDLAGMTGEIADLCEGRSWSFFWDPKSESVVQRIWSNKAARAHKDPCVPKPPGGMAYFNALAHLADTVTFSLGATTFSPIGVDAPIGIAKDIEVDLYADAPVPPWNLIAFQHPLNGGWGTSGNLAITFSQPSGQSGDKITMTIKRTAADGAPSVVAIRSTDGNLMYHSYFMVSDPTPAPPADAGAD